MEIFEKTAEHRLLAPTFVYAYPAEVSPLARRNDSDPFLTDRFTPSMLLTFGGLFGVGALRATVTTDRWWSAGLEMLVLGMVVAAAAYGSGALVALLVSSGGGAGL